MPSKTNLRKSNAAKRSDQGFRVLFDRYPSPMWIHDRKTLALLGVNRAAVKQLGYPRTALLRMTMGDLFSAEELPRLRTALKRVRQAGSVPGEWQLHLKDGSMLVVGVDAQSLTFDDHAAMLITIRPISLSSLERSIMEARMRLSEWAYSHSLDELLQKTLDETEALTGSRVGFFHLVQPDQVNLSLQMWSTNTLKNMCKTEGKGMHYSIDQAGVWADCVYQRKPVIHNDYAALSHRKGYPEGHAPLVRELVVPVIREERIVAIFGVGNKPENYTETDVTAVSLLADLAWDITERKRADAALQESEWRNKIISELITDYIFVVDVNSDGGLKLRWASENMEKLAGRSIADAATSDTWGDIIHPEDRATFFHFVDRVQSNGDAGELECRTFHKNGNERWVRIFVQPQLDKTHAVKTIVGAITDITDHKRAELALRSSESRYRIIADNTYDWEFWQDPDGNFIYSSPSCERITGYRADEFTRDPELLLRIVHLDDREFVRFHNQYVATEKIVDEIEFRVVLSDENVRWINHVCQPVFNEVGTFLGTRGSNRDVTERKRMEDLLQSWASFTHLNPSPVLRFDPDGRITLANIAAFRAFQVDSFSDQTVFELFPALHPAQVRSIIYEDALFRFEMRIGERDFRFMVRGSHGLESGYMYGSDITERKQAEEELRRANESVEAINRVLQQAFEREQQISRTDSLTSIYNRGHFFNLAAQEFAVAKRYRRPLSLIIFDLDHFKQVNDQWGHQVGDIILKSVAQIARDQLREADILARYGGEEFIILLPNSSAAEAMIVAERIRYNVAAFHYEMNGDFVKVTLSVGIAELRSDVGSLDQLVQFADQALYAAKAAGRNRVMVYSTEDAK